MHHIEQEVHLASRTNVSVLLQGETGVGKDHLAYIIHTGSNWRKGPFVSINVSAVPDQLFESELFGHEKGAFTGAVQPKPGLIEVASGGTLLLNEVGDIPWASQAKLLSYLDSGHYFRVGGVTRRRTQARIISATNGNLLEAVERKQFRADLYFRLAGITIRIPPVRERSDVAELAWELCLELARKKGMENAPGIDPEALRILVHHRWPGNVRQMKHCLELALSSCDGQCIKREDLHFFDCGCLASGHGDDQSLSALVRILPGQSLKEALDAAKAELVTKALEESGGSLAEAARLLGISRDALKYLRRVKGE